MGEWDELHDLDKGAVLLHLWKDEQEGRRYADEHYPAKFLHDPALKALDRDEANTYAHRFRAIAQALPDDEWTLLYDRALEVP